MGGYIAPLVGHLDAGLTTFIKGFQNNQLFSDRLAPRVPTPRQSDRYWIWGRETQQVLENQLRAAGAEPQRIKRTLSNLPFFADSHALSAEIVDEARLNVDPGIGDLTQDAAAALMLKILLGKEVNLAALLTSTANVTNNITLSAGSQWDAYLPNSNLNDVSAPFSVIEGAKALIRQSGVKPNWMLIGDKVYQALVNHPSIVDRFKYTNPKGTITDEQLSIAFQMPVYVGSAVVVDQNGVVSFVWGKNAIIGYTKEADGGGVAVDEYNVPAAGRYDLSSCKSFVWMGAPGTIGGLGTIIERKYPQSSKVEPRERGLLLRPGAHRA